MKRTIKGKVIAINEVVLDNYEVKGRVDVLMDEPPDLKIGDCEVKQEDEDY